MALKNSLPLLNIPELIRRHPKVLRNEVCLQTVVTLRCSAAMQGHCLVYAVSTLYANATLRQSSSAVLQFMQQVLLCLVNLS